MSDIELAIAKNVMDRNVAVNTMDMGKEIAKAIMAYRSEMRQEPAKVIELLEYFVRLARTNSGARITTPDFHEENIKTAFKEAECVLGGLIPLVGITEHSGITAHHPDLNMDRYDCVGSTYEEALAKFKEFLLNYMEVTE